MSPLAPTLSAPGTVWNQLFTLDFTAEVSWADLTRLRKETGVPNLGHLNSPATRPVAGTLLECGVWGEAWLTMLQLSDTHWRIVATSTRDHSPNLSDHVELAHSMIRCLKGTLEKPLPDAVTDEGAAA